MNQCLGIDLPTLIWERMDCDLSKFDVRVADFVRLLRAEVDAVHVSHAEGRMAEQGAKRIVTVASLALWCCRYLVADGETVEVLSQIKSLAATLQPEGEPS